MIAWVRLEATTCEMELVCVRKVEEEKERKVFEPILGRKLKERELLGWAGKIF